MILKCVQWVIIYIIVIHLRLTSSLCTQDRNIFKNYTCYGFPFKQISLSQNDRPLMLTASFYDCREVSIPENVIFLINLKRLTISCTTITTIHPNAFKNLQYLYELDLGTNAISAFPDNLFLPINKLVRLNLTSNHLTELSEKMLKHLNNLEELRLSFNSISLLAQRSLYSTPSLKSLHLNNNFITIIPAKFFDISIKLRFIDLSNNNIKIVTDVFQLTQQLAFLNLSNNVIEDLQDGLFKKTSLDILNLSNNKLTILHEEALTLSTLRELHLQNNKISVMDITGEVSKGLPLSYLDIRRNRLVLLEEEFIKSANNLAVLKVDDNPWDCTCYFRMLKLRDNLPLQISNEQRDGYNPICVLGDNNDCDIKKYNLADYYSIFINALD